MATPIQRLLEAIGYPEKASGDADSSDILVDGGVVHARARSGRILLSRALTGDSAHLPRLAAFAPGRMLREEATLAAEPGPDGEAFLWQDLPEDAPAAAMQRAFETFCDSCDWWLDRVAGFSEPEPEIPPLTIRP